MGSLSIQHPDVFSFISMKEKEGLAEINISIAFDEAFQKALKVDGLLPVIFGNNRMLEVSDLLDMEKRA